MRIILLGLVMLCLLAIGTCYAEESGEPEGSTSLTDQEQSVWLEDEPPLAEAQGSGNGTTISAWVDPLESVNRAVFYFNDQVYFGIMKPVVTAYDALVPARARICIRNTFQNVSVPVRLVNNVLQGKLVNSSVELGRFIINTTLGVAGLFDPARDYFQLNPAEEDFGQTLGVYGIGDRIYLCLPFVGPSTLRDSLGLGGDYFLNPLSYLTMADWRAGVGVRSAEAVNRTSLLDSEYEKLKADSFDFYLAVRDGYLQHRRHEIVE